MLYETRKCYGGIKLHKVGSNFLVPASALPCCFFLSFVTERLQNEKEGVGANLCCLVLHYSSCRENILSCKTHSSVSSEEGFYCTKILTYFVINGLVLAEQNGSSHLCCIFTHFYIITCIAVFCKVKTK